MQPNPGDASRWTFHRLVTFSAVLFWLNLVVAVILTVLVIVAPFWPAREAREFGWVRLLGLFAGDAAVRRTALASAIGLAVTAFVFFRQPAPARSAHAKAPVRPSLPPSNVVGA